MKVKFKLSYVTFTLVILTALKKSEHRKNKLNRELGTITIIRTNSNF